jgi:tripartite-type tricarboxylate transporter receptor subunit TctC
VRLIIPFAASGGADTFTRLLTEPLGQAFGQPFVVENRPGGGGVIGTDAVARATDGHTLMMLTVTHTANETLMPNRPYVLMRDFAPVAYIGFTPSLLIVSNTLPFRSVEELVQGARAKPGSLLYASTSNGSSGHLVMEQFKALTGSVLVHVPFKGSSEAITALIAGQVPVAFVNFPEGLPFASSGRVRALAVAAGRRYETLPEVPTMAEAGYPGFEANIWFGIVAPAATPRDTVLRLNAEINSILGIAEVQKMFRSREAQIEGGTPERFAEHLRKMVSVWAKVVQEAKIKAE